MKLSNENAILKYMLNDKEGLLVDYFDTLVTRDCHPEDIKLFWAGEMSEKLKFCISGTRLMSIRKAAESTLSEKYNGLISVSYNYKQLTDEIYIRLESVDGINLKTLCDTKEMFYSISLGIESNIEKKNQKIIINRLNLLKELKRRGCRVSEK